MKTQVVNTFFKVCFFSLLFIVAAGASAYLTLTFVIKSEDIVVIPELKQKDVLYALEILSDLGLNTKVKATKYHATTPRNFIIDQDPEPGTETKKGRDVRITVSRGPKSIVMPNLSGLPVRQAKIILEENGLCMGNITRTNSSAGKTDEIISQFPSAGKTVERQNCVNLLVNAGTRIKAYRLPDFKGNHLHDVLAKINDHQLVAGKIQYIVLTDLPENVVIDQTPAPGKRVGVGGKISLVINRPGPAKDYKNGDRRHVFRYRLENGFLKQKVQVRLKFNDLSVDLYNQLMKPGRELFLFIPDIENSTLFLYVDDQLVETKFY